MNVTSIKYRKLTLLVAAVLVFLFAGNAHAVIDGISGTTFNMVAKSDYITTPDGGSILIWGYANGARAQYPGPTLIVQEGDDITISLTNELSENVSIVFPGQEVTTTGGSPGLLTAEAEPSGSPVTYTLVDVKPGTYFYHSGTRPELQIEMGLMGVIIVRPEQGPKYAYDDEATRFDHEYLFLHSEMDPVIHQQVEFGGDIDNTTYYPVYWFYNGRAATDTLLPAYADWLPTQPYNILPLMNPGDKVLIRIVGGDRHEHPFHHHGNSSLTIARDGRLLKSPTDVSTDAVGPDLATSEFTLIATPGKTLDAIFEWTGKGLDWDIYGTPADGPEFEHECNDGDGDGYDDTTSEWCEDHYKSFPTTLPGKQNLSFGGFYTGSPFMGNYGSMPPGEGGLNPFGAYTYMWHCHHEKELCNFDIFPGGMLTMLFIIPHSVMDLTP